MGRLLLYSFFIFLAGAFLYSLFFLNWFLTLLVHSGLQIDFLLDAANWLFLLALFLAGVEFAMHGLSGRQRVVRSEPVTNQRVSVGMTAYNDELSIGGAVKEFKHLKEVASIVVIDNNSVDSTAKVAARAGARVVREYVQGYGAACIRALKEARKNGNLVCLVEGDQTFVASDLKKLIAYIENVDMVFGTRTTMEIVEPDSQVTPFIHIGNVFVAKLIQIRHWGKLRVTDCGCTYRLVRPEALDKIIGELSVTGSHFLPHMLTIALKHDLKVIECPIMFRKRVGASKVVGSDFFKGLANGIQMIWTILSS